MGSLIVSKPMLGCCVAVLRKRVPLRQLQLIRLAECLRKRINLAVETVKLLSSVCALTALTLVAAVLAIPDPITHLLLVDTGVLATIELGGDVALAALVLVALVRAVGKAVAAPLFRYALAVGAAELVLGAA